jgi:DUF1365 family protein
MNSAFYQGTVSLWSDRAGLSVRQPLLAAYVRLDELDYLVACGAIGTGRFALRGFVERDYLEGGAGDLDRRVRDRVERQSGWRPRGPIGALTRLRCLGIGDDRFRLFYCLAADGISVEAVVVELADRRRTAPLVHVFDAGAGARSADGGLELAGPSAPRLFVGPPAGTIRIAFEAREQRRPVIGAQVDLARRSFEPAEARRLARQQSWSELREALSFRAGAPSRWLRAVRRQQVPLPQQPGGVSPPGTLAR